MYRNERRIINPARCLSPATSAEGKSRMRDLQSIYDVNVIPIELVTLSLITGIYMRDISKMGWLIRFVKPAIWAD
jgi:hypothetical protein